MMASLLALLSQQTPNLQTRKGLILLGLQNDFLLPDGKLPVSTESGFLDRLKTLVPAFREFGDVIWVRSEFEANRVANVDEENGDTVITGSSIGEASETSNGNGNKRKAGPDRSASVKRMKAAEAEDDEELFLTRTSDREPCCVPGSDGAKYPADIKALIDNKKDMQVVKTYYSAFGSTSLLLRLRCQLITELFVCGCNTNLSVFATAMDAARYGIKITLIEDCLGYRKRARHDEAIRQLVEIMEADVMTSKKVVDVLRNPPPEEDESEGGSDGEEGEELGFGEDAIKAHQIDALAADSDEDEDGENDMLNVCQSLQSGKGLALRYLSSLGTRSRPAAPTIECAPASQHAEPASAQHPVIRSFAVGERKPSRRPSDGHGSGGGTDGVEPTVAGCAGRGSVEESVEESRTRAARQVMSDIAGRSANSASHEPSEMTQLLRRVIDSRPLRSDVKIPPRSCHPGLAGLSVAAGLSQETVDEYEKFMQQAREQNSAPHAQISKGKPLFGEDKEEESAGSRILYDLLPPELAETIFEELNREVDWQRMHHQTGEVPRLVCCQGDIMADGSMPVYRHPSDQTLPLQTWSPSVEKVRRAAVGAVGHPLNHVLIQLYRGGTDYISEHSDKTLDIFKSSNIVNVSIGAQRTMRLRTKRAAHPTSAPSAADELTLPLPTRTTYRISLPHNSMITMSLETNAEYLHGINADKRPAVEFTDAEKAFESQRISLTFRHIGTFLSADATRIWGQGATGKSEDDAKPAINGDAAESERLVRAFGAENQASSIDWEAVYGKGSDVLHLK